MTHKPTEETQGAVAALSSVGVPHTEIAKYLGISEPTLKKYYDDVLEKGKHDKNIAVANFLFFAASGGALKKGASYADCIRAAIFWGKTRMGMSDKTNIDLTSSDGSMTPKGLPDFYASLNNTDDE